MKLLSGIQGIFVYLLLALEQVSCILILRVSPCHKDYTCDGNMTPNLIDLNLNKTNLETLRTWLCHVSKDKDPTVKLRVSTLQKLRINIDCFKVDSFCAHCKTVFEALSCFYLYCPCQEARSSVAEEDMERGNKKRNRPDEKAV